MSTFNSETRLKLNLLENSISFIEEAIDKILSAQDNNRAWKFAILHMTHSLELSLKEILKREHHLFIFEDIDNPKKTIGIDLAIKRLDSLVKRPLIKADIDVIKEVQSLRNSIIHYEVDFSVERARIILAHLVGFINYIHESFLDNKLIDNLPHDHYEFIFQNKTLAEEITKRAMQRIQEEGIDKNSVIFCPFCDSWTMVINGKGTSAECYSCHMTDFVERCAGCENYFTESEMDDFSNEFEYSNEGREYKLENDYGFREHKACVDCIDSIRENIKERRLEDDHYRELDYYYRKK